MKQGENRGKSRKGLGEERAATWTVRWLDGMASQHGDVLLVGQPINTYASLMDWPAEVAKPPITF